MSPLVTEEMISRQPPEAQAIIRALLVETILTVVETCRQQKRNHFAFLADAIQAHRAPNQQPKLLTGA